MMLLLGKLEKSKDFWFLLTTSFIFFILRLPSIFEPYWYGDEGIYQVIGTVLRAGGEMYVDAFDNKPPLLFVIYYLFNGDQASIRFLSLIFGILSIIFFFFTSKKIFFSKIAYLITSVFAFLLAIPAIEGNIANTENFMILPIILAVLLFLTFMENKNKKFLYLSGLTLGITFLFKVVAIFDFLAFLTFLIFSINFKNIKANFLNKIKELFSFSFIFSLPLLLTSLYFFLDNNFINFSKAVLFSNFSYVNVGNEFIIPQGLLLLKISLLMLGLIFLFLKRSSLGKIKTFILIWFLFSLFNVFFSQRPYTHYLILLLPSFFLLLGTVLKEELLKQKMIMSSFLFLSVIILFSYFPIFSKTNSYYANFIDFLTGKKSLIEYRNFFDGNTQRDYLLSDFIRENTTKKDHIFIWGNNPQLYKLSEKNPPTKYSAAYHILSYEDGINNTRMNLDLKKPKLVLIFPINDPFPIELIGYKEKKEIKGVKIYERIY